MSWELLIVPLSCSISSVQTFPPLFWEQSRLWARCRARPLCECPLAGEPRSLPHSRQPMGNEQRPVSKLPRSMTLAAFSPSHRGSLAEPSVACLVDASCQRNSHGRKPSGDEPGGGLTWVFLVLPGRQEASAQGQPQFPWGARGCRPPHALTPLKKEGGLLG